MTGAQTEPSGRLHMVRLDPDLARAARWGATQGLTSPGADDGYLWHALLKAAFGDLAPKPFRLVEPAGGAGRPYFIGYARADAGALRAHAEAFADPAVVPAVGLESLAVKAMPVAFPAGARLGFDVRLRPTVRQTRDGDRTRKREIDVFLQVASRDPAAPKPDRLAVYAEWLAGQMAAGGVRLDGVSLTAQRRARILRRSRIAEDGARRLEAHGRQGGGPDIVMAGDLVVEDPAAFAGLLARGVGRHRAFGFGMLLLKPPGRAPGGG
jgi:CRISPR system Cascade subunit CasE